MAGARSYLFVPGDRPDMLAGSSRRDADALIADLEDAVAPSAKNDARETVAKWVSGLGEAPPDVWVRVNHPGDMFEADVRAITAARLAGLMIPKVSTASDLDGAARLLDEIEQEQSIPPGSIRLLPIVETAAGLLAVAQLAAARRVNQLMIGELDLSAELGIKPTNSEALLPLRMQIVVASAAYGLEPPLGPVSPNFQDLEALRDETAALAGLGFGSRPAIHPAQVPVFNDVFEPSPQEVAKARRLVTLYEAALAEGRGAVTDDEGHMVDEAVVRVARRLLARGRGEATR